MCSTPLLLILIITVVHFIGHQSAEDADLLEPYLGRKYELEDGDNEHFEPLMEYLGVGWFMRKGILMASPVMWLSKEGEEYTLTSDSFWKTINTKFRLGEEFVEETPDGRNATSRFTVEGNKLIQTQEDNNGKLTTTVREFTADQVNVTATVDHLSCCRIYKALEN